MNGTAVRRTALSAAIAVMVSPLPTRAQAAPPAANDSAYSPGEYRVFAGDGEPAELDDIIEAMDSVAVVFIGEAHDDPTGHMLELELLRRALDAHGETASEEAGGAEGRPVALSLEFFQRDAQPILDEYLAGLITESAFRADSRPWPRYGTDYRPLIELARERGIPVIAANAPRRYANRVTREGRQSLLDLSPEALETLPPLPYGQPSEEYRDQWIRVISEVMEQEGTKCGLPLPEPEEGDAPVHGAAPPGAHDDMGNQLHSQTLWDATMAWWIADHLFREPDALVLHMVGSFHVARGTGTPEHLEAYRPGTPRLIVVLRPVEDVDAFEPAPEGEWGDFAIQTDAARTLEAIECRAWLSEREAGGTR